MKFDLFGNSFRGLWTVAVLPARGTNSFFELYSRASLSIGLSLFRERCGGSGRTPMVVYLNHAALLQCERITRVPTKHESTPHVERQKKAAVCACVECVAMSGLHTVHFTLF